MWTTRGYDKETSWASNYAPRHTRSRLQVSSNFRAVPTPLKWEKLSEANPIRVNAPGQQALKGFCFSSRPRHCDFKLDKTLWFQTETDTQIHEWKGPLGFQAEQHIMHTLGSHYCKHTDERGGTLQTIIRPTYAMTRVHSELQRPISQDDVAFLNDKLRPHCAHTRLTLMQTYCWNRLYAAENHWTNICNDKGSLWTAKIHFTRWRGTLHTMNVHTAH